MKKLESSGRGRAPHVGDKQLVELTSSQDAKLTRISVHFSCEGYRQNLDQWFLTLRWIPTGKHWLGIQAPQNADKILLNHLKSWSAACSFQSEPYTIYRSLFLHNRSVLFQPALILFEALTFNPHSRSQAGFKTHKFSTSTDVWHQILLVNVVRARRRFLKSTSAQVDRCVY